MRYGKLLLPSAVDCRVSACLPERTTAQGVHGVFRTSAARSIRPRPPERVIFGYKESR
jgi:hypothetical protein